MRTETETKSQDILIHSIAYSMASKGKDPTKIDLSMFGESDRLAIYKKTADLKVQNIIEGIKKANEEDYAIPVREEGIESIAKLYEIAGVPDSMITFGDMLLENDYPGDAAVCYKLANDKNRMLTAYDKMLESGNMCRIRDGARGYLELDVPDTIDKLEKIAKNYMAKQNYEGAMATYLVLGSQYREETLDATNKYLEKTGMAWYVENIYRSLGSKDGLAAVAVMYLKGDRKKDAMKIFKEIGREDLIKLSKDL